MLRDIIGNISRLIYNDLVETLTIVYSDGERKEIKLTKEEYEEMIKTGNFSILSNV